MINKEVSSRPTVVGVTSWEVIGGDPAYPKVTEAMKTSIVKFMNRGGGKKGVWKTSGGKTIFGAAARMVDGDYYERYYDDDYNMRLYEAAEDNFERAREQLQMAQQLLRLKRSN